LRLLLLQFCGTVSYNMSGYLLGDLILKRTHERSSESSVWIDLVEGRLEEHAVLAKFLLRIFTLRGVSVLCRLLLAMKLVHFGA